MNVDFNLIILVVTPSIIIALVAYFSIQSMLKKEIMKQKYVLLKTNQKEALPIKLQAYERLTLLIDRVSLDKLMVRMAPIGEDKVDYKNLLLATIDQEFEHNSTQQIYISEDCWKAIFSAKATIIAQIHQMTLTKEIETANDLRTQGIQNSIAINASAVAKSFIRAEVGELFN